MAKKSKGTSADSKGKKSSKHAFKGAAKLLGKSAKSAHAGKFVITRSSKTSFFKGNAGHVPAPLVSSGRSDAAEAMLPHSVSTQRGKAEYAVSVHNFEPERGIAVLEFNSERVRYTRERSAEQVFAIADYLRACQTSPRSTSRWTIPPTPSPKCFSRYAEGGRFARVTFGGKCAAALASTIRWPLERRGFLTASTTRSPTPEIRKLSSGSEFAPTHWLQRIGRSPSASRVRCTMITDYRASGGGASGTLACCTWTVSTVSGSITDSPIRFTSLIRWERPPRRN